MPLSSSSFRKVSLVTLVGSVVGLLTASCGGSGGNSGSSVTVNPPIPVYNIALIPNFIGQRMNNNRQIIGDAPDGDVNGPAVWSNGVVTIVGPKQAQAQGISADGIVVGDAFDPSRGNDVYAAILSGGKATFLPVSGSGGSLAYGINSTHTIVGRFDPSETPPGQTAAFELKDNKFSELPNPPGDTDSMAWDINDSGSIVGWTFSSNKLHAVAWTAGIPHDLGTLGGATSSAAAINNEGVVVGRSDLAPGVRGVLHAFSWFNGKMTDLGSIGLDPISDAYAINNKGQIVGNSGDNSLQHAVIWNNGTITDLNTHIKTPGWVLYNALSITDTGQIMGLGTYNGAAATFLLTPPPPV